MPWMLRCSFSCHAAHVAALWWRQLRLTHVLMLYCCISWLLGELSTHSARFSWLHPSQHFGWHRGLSYCDTPTAILNTHLLSDYILWSHHFFHSVALTLFNLAAMVWEWWIPLRHEVKYVFFCLFGVRLNFRGRELCKFLWRNAAQALI